MNPIKLVVFDLDGTLNRTELYAVPAHKKALAERGIFDKTDGDIIATFGARYLDCGLALIGTDDLAEIERYFAKAAVYEQEFIQQYAGFYDGADQMLDRLHELGFHTAVCSNASERYIRMVLSRLGLLGQIDEIQPLMPGLIKDQTLKLLLERTKPEAAVMVGDRYYDKQAAKANSLPFIGCLHGFCPSEVADGDRAVEALSQVPDAVIELIGLPNRDDSRH